MTTPRGVPFPKAWPSIELPGYRDHPDLATYSFFAYETLPPAPSKHVQGTFDWLKARPIHAPLEAGWAEDAATRLPALVREAKAKGLTLPESFLTFIADPELVGRVRSCTDCYFELPDCLLRPPWNSEAALVHFLSDSQGCLFWYLYLDPNSDPVVLVSLNDYGDPSESVPEIDPSNTPSGDGESDSPWSEGPWLCVSSFEEFLYRFWIENEIWYAISEEARSLNDEERAYAEHYVT
ncbi:hypothetical protein [Tautonia rosea]|uniref:hypothetical protein n=1 Tax=Tautonia rosea TaxID=2728037 RepID=UPI00147615E6|nr:hypothetical protein [Tautonia rosea]